MCSVLGGSRAQENLQFVGRKKVGEGLGRPCDYVAAWMESEEGASFVMKHFEWDPSDPLLAPKFWRSGILLLDLEARLSHCG